MSKGLLVCLSVAIGLAACELALRLVHPRYALAVEPPCESWPNTAQRARNPDTGTAHYLLCNDFGGRQSRNFTAAGLAKAVNIGFFGDSLTENFLMPAQYSYTEPLDYLLNVHPAAAAKDNDDAVMTGAPSPAFNVLNFGAAGYGPARAYVRWRDLPVRRQLAHVFYAVWRNDLDDLHKAMRNGVVWLGESGDGLEFGTRRAPPWQRILSRMHLTYLVIDVRRVLAGGAPHHSNAEGERPARPRASYREAALVFGKLVRRWKREVEAEGGAFHVVVLPESSQVTDVALGAEFGVLDLHECFEAAMPGFSYADLRFAKDWHWTPAANMMAATCFYRYLEGVLGLPARPDEHLASARNAYYQAFLDSLAWEGERYMPAADWSQSASAGVPTPNPAPIGGAIVAKYLALELGRAKNERWVRAVRAARATAPLATSVWDVHANAGERLLVYAKSPCPEYLSPTAAGRFFLHVAPFTPERAAGHRGRIGFVNLDGGPFTYLRRTEQECVFSARLPDYPLSWVRTGQYTARREGAQTVYDNLWSVRFAMPLAP